MTYKCEMDADGWQLYSGEDSDAAALKLSQALTDKVTAAKQSLAGNKLLSEQKLATKVRDEMYELMSEFADCGARDTEPEWALIDELTRAFGLNDRALSRW